MLNLNQFPDKAILAPEPQLRTGLLGSKPRYTSRIVFIRMSQKGDYLHIIYFLCFFNLMVSPKSFSIYKIYSVGRNVLQISVYLVTSEF